MIKFDKEADQADQEGQIHQNATATQPETQLEHWKYKYNSLHEKNKILENGNKYMEYHFKDNKLLNNLLENIEIIEYNIYADELTKNPFKNDNKLIGDINNNKLFTNTSDNKNNQKININHKFKDQLKCSKSLSIDKFRTKSSIAYNHLLSYW